MRTYDNLLNIAEAEGISIIEKNFKSSAKGLCKGKKIGIKKDMPYNEKICILAEELGHYYKTVGNIIDTEKSFNIKQEKIARKWAVNRLLTPEELISAVVSGCEYISDVADYLGVTDSFLLEAIEIFKNTYGIIYRYDNYAIKFNEAGYSVEEIENKE